MHSHTPHAIVTRIFEEHLHLEIPSTQADLFQAGLLDSFGLVELLLHLEQQFGIEIPLEDLDFDHFRSVDDIVALVARHRRAA